VARDPEAAGDAGIQYEIGMARAQLGRLGDARSAFARAVGLDPGHYDAWRGSRSRASRSGDAAGGEAALARAAALPQAADGRVERLRRQIASTRSPGGDRDDDRGPGGAAGARGRGLPCPRLVHC